MAYFYALQKKLIMSANAIGTFYKLTSFGESHGKAVGGVIEGVLPGLDIDMDFIQREMNRRRPGQSSITTPRDEKDQVEILSGMLNGKATGTPMGFVVWNGDQRSDDYSNIKDVYRPSHADYTYNAKYGIRDHRGGGRSSARETISRVFAGAVAKLILQREGIEIYAYTSAVGDIQLGKPYSELDLKAIDSNIVRCPDAVTAQKMIDYIDQVRQDKDSVGGVITGVIKNVPAGLGEPVFNKLHAALGHAMLGINAVKGFEYGSGFGAAKMTGTQHNDEFYMDGDRVRTRTNLSGGIQGGISNGEDIYFNVAFKPIATILKEQKTVNSDGEEVNTTVKGRHDPCVLPRAVPIVEAMAAMVLADHLYMNKMYR
jgi:chorismate synthase